MENSIARQRCNHHPEREASAKCPECGYFFCSECCAEHDGRLLCQACLESTSKRGAVHQGSRIRHFVFAGSSLAGLLLLWFMFFLLGDLLLSIPDSWVDMRTKTLTATEKP